MVEVHIEVSSKVSQPHESRSASATQPSTALDAFLAEFKSRYKINPTKCQLPDECIERWRRDSKLDQSQLLDALTLRLAAGFLSRELDFSFCSVFIRRLKDSAHGEWPPFFWDVFIAFDAGEFFHGDERDGDPSETHSRPMIRAILDENRLDEIGCAGCPEITRDVP